ATFDPALPLAGVILNRVGGPGHARLLTDALEPVGVPVLGSVGEDRRLAQEQRHLGLVPAAEDPASAKRIIAAAQALVERELELEHVMALAAAAPPMSVQPWRPDAHRGPTTRRITVGVARGAAFTFGYQENLELLVGGGADLAPFDPVSDEGLPRGVDALYLGGGFPELYADALAANSRLRHEVRSFAATGRPVVAECAGLTYLAHGLDGRPMCGVLDAQAHMTEHLAIGYREATAVRDSALAPAGYRVRGQEFHRSGVSPPAGRPAAWMLADPVDARSSLPGERAEGFVRGGVHASYLHTHWAAFPELAARLLASAARDTSVG
ncbi:MAG: cobyrinate a,c-diamide synthase, partial [Actinobacteria bacterium]